MKEIKKYPQRITKLKPFIDKYTCERIKLGGENRYSFNDSKQKRWHYLAVKDLPDLLKRITSKHDCDFYFLNWSHSFRTEKKLGSHKQICENKDFWNIAMPSEDTKRLEFNQKQKSNKAWFFMYLDLECFLEKTDGCKYDPQNHLQQQT